MVKSLTVSVEADYAASLALGMGGAQIYFAMQYLVRPLSTGTKGPVSFKGMPQGIIVHILCVGFPAARIARRLAKEI